MAQRVRSTPLPRKEGVMATVLPPQRRSGKTLGGRQLQYFDVVLFSVLPKWIQERSAKSTPTICWPTTFAPALLRKRPQSRAATRHSMHIREQPTCQRRACLTNRPRSLLASTYVCLQSSIVTWSGLPLLEDGGTALMKRQNGVQMLAEESGRYVTQRKSEKHINCEKKWFWETA